MANTEDPKNVLEEVRRLLSENGMASLSELERYTGVSRNWLSGFMAALEALGVVSCKGLSRSTCFRKEEVSLENALPRREFSWVDERT